MPTLGSVQDIDLKLLRVFDFVARSGGFSAAQAALNMNQSTISTYMSQLESRLGMRLCFRGNAGFGLTEEGKTILAEARELFAALDNFRDRANDCFANLRGDIVIGITDALSTHPNRILVDFIRDFSQANPGARIRIEIANAKDMEEKTIRGEIDVSFGFFYHRVDTLTYSEVFRETSFLYCGSENPLFRIADHELELTAIAAHPYVEMGYYEETTPLKADPQFTAGATSMFIEGVALLILTGRFIGYLPDHYAEQWIRSGRMRRIAAGSTEKTAVLEMITRAGGIHSRALARFIAAFQQSRQE